MKKLFSKIIVLGTMAMLFFVMAGASCDMPNPNPCGQDPCICGVAMACAECSEASCICAVIMVCSECNEAVCICESNQEKWDTITPYTKSVYINGGFLGYVIAEMYVPYTSFRLTVTVNRRYARVGDTIEIKTTLENLSGKDLSISYFYPFGLFMNGLGIDTNFNFQWSIDNNVCEVEFFENPWEFTRLGKIYEGAIISQTNEFVIDEFFNHHVVAGVFFECVDFGFFYAVNGQILIEIFVEPPEHYVVVYAEFEEFDLLFRMTLIADRIEAYIGEAVRLVAVIENLSGRYLSLFNDQASVLSTHLLNEGISPGHISRPMPGAIHFVPPIPVIAIQNQHYMIESESYNNAFVLLMFDTIYDGMWPGTFGGDWVDAGWQYEIGAIQIFIKDCPFSIKPAEQTGNFIEYMCAELFMEIQTNLNPNSNSYSFPLVVAYFGTFDGMPVVGYIPQSISFTTQRITIHGLEFMIPQTFRLGVWTGDGISTISIYRGDRGAGLLGRLEFDELQIVYERYNKFLTTAFTSNPTNFHGTQIELRRLAARVRLLFDLSR